MTARPGPGTPGKVVSATDHRRALGAFMAPGSPTDPLATRSGIVPAPGNPLKVSQNSPLGMSAIVRPGNTEIHRTGRGPYTPYNDALDVVAFDPAPATNSRWDLVYIAQADSEVDGGSASTLGVLKGSARTSPPKPYGDLPAGGLVLAEVGPITSTTTTITDSLIANVAPFTAVRGAPIPVRNQVERDALNSIASATYPITVDRLDTATMERNAGSGWVAVGKAPTPWTAYAPTLTSDGQTQPSGYSATARYKQVETLVVVSFQIVAGAGFTPGAGNYRLSLPVTAGTVLAVTNGTVRLFDSSTGQACLGARIATTTSAAAAFQAVLGGALANVGATVPWTWAPGDILDGTFTYEAAIAA